MQLKTEEYYLLIRCFQKVISNAYESSEHKNVKVMLPKLTRVAALLKDGRFIDFDKELSILGQAEQHNFDVQFMKQTFFVPNYSIPLECSIDTLHYCFLVYLGRPEELLKYINDHPVPDKVSHIENMALFQKLLLLVKLFTEIRYS